MKKRKSKKKRRREKEPQTVGDFPLVRNFRIPEVALGGSREDACSFWNGCSTLCHFDARPKHMDGKGDH